MKKLLTLVIPVFNEEDNIIPLYETVLQVMQPLNDRYGFELVFTDNHSTDCTFEILRSLALNDSRVRVYRFSRNFGYQRSIATGYFNARGVAAIQIDCDMQDPPEMIPRFVELWEQGYQVVYGVRRSRQEAWYINLLRKIFYRLIDFLSEDKLPLDAGDFRLLDRVILDELKKMDDSQPYLRGAIATIGFNQIGIEYDRNLRTRGESKFSFREYINLSIDGVMNHSILPLRIATYIGITVSIITMFALACYLFNKLVLGKSWPAGFATTTALILMSLSLNALFLGIIGEYLGRIYKQVKKKPTTIIESVISTSDKTELTSTRNIH